MTERFPDMAPLNTKCGRRGYHRDKEFIDPQSGGYVRCEDCGRVIDCEDPDGDCAND